MKKVIAPNNRNRGRPVEMNCAYKGSRNNASATNAIARNLGGVEFGIEC